MLIIVVVLGPPVVPIDEILVEPCIMMAALIGWTQAESFAWDGESTMHAYLRYRSEPGGLKDPQTSAQLFGIDPGPHKGVGPGGGRQGTISKGFVNSTEVVSSAKSPCSTIEITCMTHA